MKHAVIAGRHGYLAGRMQKKLYATASSPLEGSLALVRTMQHTLRAPPFNAKRLGVPPVRAITHSARSAHSRSSRLPSYISELDGLRGLAIGAVLIYHCHTNSITSVSIPSRNGDGPASISSSFSPASSSPASSPTRARTHTSSRISTRAADSASGPSTSCSSSSSTFSCHSSSPEQVVGLA